MTARRGLEERFVVPRWRPFRATRALGELDHPRIGAEQTLSDAEDSPDTHRFEESPGLHMASDVLDQALNRPGTPNEALPAARFVLGAANAPPDMRRLAQMIEGRVRGLTPDADDRDLDLPEPAAQVRHWRRSLRRFPRNPTAWMDLALAQTIGGDLNRARRSVITALALAPHNRFILRSASRFFVHIADPERAKAILTTAATQSGDPWLMAAEIATSQISGRASTLILPARRTLQARQFLPAHASELACAVASLDLGSGNDKRARKFLYQALEDPTENTVAQAEFESRRSRISVPETLVAQEGRFEAQALDFASRSLWTQSISAAQQWQADQPFAPDPAMYLSYIAAVRLEDYETARRAAAIGFVANPHSSMLANNLAFALANLGDWEMASQTLERIAEGSLKPPEVPVVSATQGLVAFRAGDPERGRLLYSAAVAEASRQSATDQAAFAATYWAREELRIGSPFATEVVGAARIAVERSRHPDARAVFDRLSQLPR